MKWSDLDGYFDFADLYDREVARVTGPAVFVEIGVYKGRSIAYLAEAIRASGKPIKLYAVDSFAFGTGRAEFEQNMKACGWLDGLTIIQADSAEAATRFEPASVDFAYIDADHSYEGVRRDIEAWRPKIKPGGTLAGHDRVRAGVDRAVREAFPEFEALGVLSWVVRL